MQCAAASCGTSVESPVHAIASGPLMGLKRIAATEDALNTPEGGNIGEMDVPQSSPTCVTLSLL